MYAIIINVTIVFFEDGATGNGDTIGKCPTIPSNLKCLSTGECNICKDISGRHEGCDVTSTTPVCDADSATDGIQDIADGKIAQCTACMKDGRHFIFRKMTLQSI